MSSTKKDKLRAVREMFHKKKVLKINDIFKILGTKSRMTAYRYMKEMDYLTSYSHKAQYYTLREIAKFDSHGLWIYDDIGFSRLSFPHFQTPTTRTTAFATLSGNKQGVN